MEYTHIRYSDITTCIDSVSARAGELGDGWSPNELYEGEQSHAYIIKHPIENTIDSLWWNTLTSGKWHYYVYWFCECQSSTTGGRMVSKWIVWGRAVSCLHNQAPIETQLTSCDGIHSHQLQWHYYLYWFCSARAGELEDGWSPNELCEGEQSHAYIIRHPISTQLTSCDGIHSHQVRDITTCIDSVSARAGELGTDGLQMNCMRESSLMLT